MQIKVIESSRGGHTVSVGLQHKGGERVPGILGFTMPAFIEYESSHCDTKAEVRRMVKKFEKEGNNLLEENKEAIT